MADLFIGEDVDPAKHERTGTKVNLPSGDFTTHGVIVGMTGSGKTGLGIVLIEECLNAGIPTLLIDPKGDLTNLCLTFPTLAVADFQPWVNEGDAQKDGLSLADFAAKQAADWTAGLAGWGYGPERIKALRDHVTFTIYTPGSTAGVPINIVGSLQAPGDTSDIETMRDEIEGYVSGVLGLVGIDSDPLSSPEHILLATLIETSWMAGRSLDLTTLVASIQNPPLRKLGVFELDQFFPLKDRTALAMRLNGLLASPSFAAWSAGPAVDIGSLTRTADGKPRCAIVTTAHLSDEERQFVTALVLAKVVTWMRKQSGTTDLRMLLYMDEVAGYVPPTAVPPTKKPIMTLMKQARAFGVGVVLATQNPVDVDYKAISNAGTWMIGRLQTDRDKARLLDGMSAAAGGVDTAAVGDTISGLAKREFVLRRAGKDKPEVFTTRWAMSYLRGPLTREQIASLMATAPEKTPAGAGVPAARPTSPAPAETVPAALAPPSAGARPTGPPPTASPPSAAPPASPAEPASPAVVATPNVPPPPGPAAAGAAAPTPASASGSLDHDETPVMPQVAPSVDVRWVDPAAPWLARIGGSAYGTRFEPAIVARVNLRYDEVKADLIHDEEYELVVFPLSATPDFAMAYAVDYDDRDLRREPPPTRTYSLVAAPLSSASFWTNAKRDLVDALARSKSLQIMTNRDLKLFSRPGETPEQFHARCQEAADAKADAATALLRDKYEARAKRIQDAINAAEDRVDVLDAERKGRRNQEILGTAGSILGGLFGGRRRRGAGGILGSLGTAAGRRSRSATSGERLDAAKNKVEALHDDLADLEAEAAQDVAEIDSAWNAKAAAITTVPIPLERTDVKVAQLVLAWVPIG